MRIGASKVDGGSEARSLDFFQVGSNLGRCVQECCEVFGALFMWRKAVVLAMSSKLAKPFVYVSALGE